MNALRTRYPGAQPFSDDPLSRCFFFGRARELDTLKHQVIANRLTVLFARSGLGKTSLINAGLCEALWGEGFFPLVVRVNDKDQGALHTIYDGIEKACLKRSVEYVEGRKDNLWLFFKTAEFWREDLLLTPVLIIDQFEELFTLQTERNRAELVDELSCLLRGVRPDVVTGAQGPEGEEGEPDAVPLSDSPPAIRVLLGIREDFLGDLEDLADRIPGILNERFRLLPLSRDQAREALELPAGVNDSALSGAVATRPFKIDTDCENVILDFLEQKSFRGARVVRGDIEPFQLQLICQRIEDIAQELQLRTPEQGTVHVTRDILGGESNLGRILKSFYRKQLHAVPFWKRGRVRRLCSEHLITPQGRRIRMEESEIQRLTGVESDVLKAMVERRLLRRDQTTNGEYYEISHDSLVGPIMNSRRLWFIGKAVFWSLLTLFLIFLVWDTIVSNLGEMFSDLTTADEWILVGGLVACILALFWVLGRRVFRNAQENWRRGLL